MKVNLDELFLKSVCIDPDPVSVDELKHIYSQLQDVYDETATYVRDSMGSGQFMFEMRLPVRNINIVSIMNNNPDSGLELIHIPFLTCSLGVWEKLMADKDNPVFELAGFINKCITFIRSTMDIAGYDTYTPLTSEALDSCNIMDVFSTHSFEYIYDDISRYIG